MKPRATLITARGALEDLRTAFPDAVIDGAVSRHALKQIISRDPSALKRIEGIVHPLVAEDRAAFVAASRADVIVFDIPLLFETGGDTAMDAVVVVTAPADVQKVRVMDRGTMTEAQFEQIRAKQMPDDQKRARADFVVVTDTLEHARAQVQSVIKQVKNRQTHA